MRIIACLSWYDENPAWLAATTASLAKVADHLVALDGGYFLYPQAKPRSETVQHQTIYETALAEGIGCTIHVPQTVWYGNEVEKRATMFRIAECNAEANEDWYLVIDADELIVEAPSDTKEQLQATDKDCANVFFVERQHKPEEIASQFEWDTGGFFTPRFFRAIPGLEVAGNHYTYVANGRKLWTRYDEDSEPAEDLTGLVMHHRGDFRAKARLRDRQTYYDRRDELGVEKEVLPA